MKKSRLVSLLIAVLMIATIVLPLNAFAAGENGSITIKAPDGLTLEDQVFTAYQIFKVTNSGTNYNYTLLEPFDDFFDTDLGIVAGGGENGLKAYLEGDPDMIALSKALFNFINGDPAPTNLVPKTSEAGSAGSKSLAITGLDYGYYIVLGSGTAEGDQSVVAIAALGTVPGSPGGSTNKDINITLKADAPWITKEVWNSNLDEEEEAIGYTDWADVNINDEVSFKLTSKVPAMLGYATYEYIVYDTMSPGLTFKDGSITITVGGVLVNVIDADSYNNEAHTATYEIENYVLNGNEYNGGKLITINFPDLVALVNKSNEDTIVAGADIVITYNATLNEDAIVGAPGNPNKVYLEYSNNPNWVADGEDDEEPTGETPEDEVIVYTFDVDVYKYAGALLPGNPLEGAEFVLYRTKSGTDYSDEVKFVYDSTDGVYYVKMNSTVEDSEIIISNAAGRISIVGLDAGTYYLKETKAPDGYNLSNDYKEFVITHTTKDGIANISNKIEVTPAEGDKFYAVTYVNTTGNILPETGGIGRYIVYGAGIALAIGVAVLLVIRRKIRLIQD